MEREIVYRDAQRQARQVSPQSKECHEASELHPKVQSPEGMGNGGIRGAKERGRPMGEDEDENAAGSSIMCSLLFFSKCSTESCKQGNKFLFLFFITIFKMSPLLPISLSRVNDQGPGGTCSLN